jgi:hypothetical protein
VGRGTVGGTSFAALRPGFLRGGRIHVLLNAPFEITSGISDCAASEWEG